jgi:Flp pilus assembly protein TadG
MRSSPSNPVSQNRSAVARSQRRGTAAIEFAILAPLLITLVLGLIEFGRVMMVEQVLTNAAREGCRTGVLPGNAASDVRNTVTTYLSNSSITLSDPTNQISVNPDPGTASSGTAITVTINIPFNSVSWLPVPVFMLDKTLSSSVVMRKESNNS